MPQRAERSRTNETRLHWSANQAYGRTAAIVRKTVVMGLVGGTRRGRVVQSWAEAVALPSLLLAISACGRLVGADEYGFAPDTTVSNPCAEDQVLTDEGICERIGAQECGGSFEFGDFGCVATLPAEDCSASGGIAQLGSRNCGQLDNDTMCDLDGFAAPGNTQEFLVRYADADADVAEEGTGLTKASAFRTIGGALASVAKEDPQGLKHLLLLLKGEFKEDVVIDRSNVEIRGCFGKAKLAGQEPKQPTQLPGTRCFPPGGEREGRRAALCVAPGQSKIILEGLQISGPGDGIQVMGATDVWLRRVRIHDTGYFGMRISEVKVSDSTGGGAAASTIKPAVVNLDLVAIYGAHGAAILVAGSKLTVANSSIQHTQSLNDWANLEDSFGAASESARVPEHAKIGWARGISIHPGLYPDDGMSPEPVHFAQSTVTIQNSVITGHGEVALFAAGATVNLAEVFVGATSSGAVSGRGLVAEQSLPVGKETTVTIDHSIIEGASDAAVDVRDASVTLTHTTVRDTRGRVGDGCSGQGVRVRSFPTRDGSPSTLDAFDSSILGSRQAGVFSASSKVSLTRTLIRDVKPETEAACSRSMGDGIVLEGYRDQEPASLVLERVRVENAARAAITWSGGPLSMRSTVLACNQRDLVDPTGLGQLADPREGVCGCGASWARCALRSEPLDSWVVSGPSGAWPDVTNDIVFCFTTLAGLRINDGWASSFFSPEIAPSSRGSDGCTRIVSSRREVLALLGWAPGYPAGISFESPQIEFGFVAGPTLAQLSTSRGRPTGIPMFFTDAPVGSRLTAAPAAETLDGLGQQLPPDGKIPESPIIVTAVIRANEPGWHALEVSDLPAEFVCRGSDVLGAHTRPSVRFGYAEWGSFTLIGFSDCRASAP